MAAMDHSPLRLDELKAMKTLRKRIESAGIPPSKLDETINIATWNIRHWGAKRRKRCSLHYIAEILHQFDLIAVTELRRNIRELRYVLDLLGPYWDAVYSDYTEDAGGNKERIAFIYDTRAVQSTGLAAESDGPREKDRDTGQYVPLFNWWRKPYLASFKAGSFDFVMLAVHLQWGTTAGRMAELEALADWVNSFQKDELRTDRDVIAVGDFNITSYGSNLYKAVSKHGLSAPASLLAQEFGSNLARNKRYDQILHHPTITGSVFSKHGGVVDFYKGDHRVLSPYKDMSKTGFTYELSDHLPLWCQLNVDVAGDQLDKLIEKREA
jgi:endonuclease/exonuclease/phosphatase family metal-dependent hydrolase